MAEKKVNIEELIQDDHNFNRGTERGQELIKKSFNELGAGRSILLDKDNRIIAGNKSQLAAIDAGIKKVRIIETDGKELIAVKRTDVTLDSKEGRIIGISKIARVVNYCSARLQLQERLARDIVKMLADAIDNQCQGMAIVMKGTHLCKTMRGVRSQGQMTVSYLSGAFKTDDKARQEFYKLIDAQ